MSNIGFDSPRKIEFCFNNVIFQVLLFGLVVFVAVMAEDFTDEETAALEELREAGLLEANIGEL